MSLNSELDDLTRMLDLAAREEAFRLFAGMTNWRFMLSATFRWVAGEDTARHFWRAFVAQSNKRVFGKNYTRKVGHSYYSYLVGYERQAREAYHFHAVIGEPIEMAWAQQWLERVAGHTWVQRVESQVAAVRYCTKYIVKDGDVAAFRTKSVRLPAELPAWWY